MLLTTTHSHLLITTEMPPAILILISKLLDADDLKPPDVGIDSTMPCFKHAAGSKGPPPVTYLHFYDCSKFSVILQIPYAFFPTTKKKGSLLNRCFFFCMVSAVWHILFTQISRHSTPQPSWVDSLQQDPFWFHALEVV
jgi:hypothetical protein